MESIEHQMREDKLAALPPLYRNVLSHVFDGGSPDDLACLSGISAKTIDRLMGELDDLPQEQRMASGLR